MARSEYVTWLPLDEWFGIMGIHPLYGNQLESPTLQRNVVAGGPWFQNAFQHSDRIGRDDLAIVIQEAERQIAAEVGYDLMPDWTTGERLTYPRPGIPGAYNVWGTNPRGAFKSVELRKGWIISGGVRVKTLLQQGVTFTRTDADVDGYDETCTAIVPVTFTDINLIHAYYPAQNGDDGWEIRPISVTISGGNATIILKSWQVAAANQMGSLNPQALDADDPNSYETEIDVYTVGNDPSQQVQFLWENPGVPYMYWPTISACGGCGTCQACQFGTQNGCFHLRDQRQGLIVPGPGAWNSSTQGFDFSSWSMCREPDQIIANYYSGFVDTRLKRPYCEVPTYWKTAIAYFAAGKLDRPVYGASNVQEFVERWRKDAVYSSIADGGMQITPEFAANRLGTSAGALYAFRRVQQNGIKVSK